MTDDPADPCPYCVHWEEPVGPMHSGNFEEAVPWVAPGVKAERIYQYCHDDCEKAVAQYVSEARL